MKRQMQMLRFMHARKLFPDERTGLLTATFNKMGFKIEASGDTIRYYSELVSLPIHPALQLTEACFVVNELHKDA